MSLIFQKEEQIVMKVFRTNFNFEKQIISGATKNNSEFITSSLNYEFEYLFFYYYQDYILNTPIKYDSDYLKYMREHFGIKAEIENTPMPDFKYWWGDTSNIEKAKQLNNKVFFWKFCLSSNIPYPRTIDSIRDLSTLNTQLIIRKKMGFSGQGLKLIHRSEMKSFQNDTLVSNYHQRELDFGLIIHSCSNVSVYRNKIDQFGQYKGSESIFDENFFLKHHIDPYLSQFDGLNEYGDYPFQIDGFISNGSVYFHELNYRKTMGLIFDFMMRKFFPNKSGRLRIMKYEEYQKQWGSSANTFYLTPRDKEKTYRFGLVLELSEPNRDFEYNK
jgi:hypothetical protein